MKLCEIIIIFAFGCQILWSMDWDNDEDYFSLSFPEYEEPLDLPWSMNCNNKFNDEDYFSLSVPEYKEPLDLLGISDGNYGNKQQNYSNSSTSGYKHNSLSFLQHPPQKRPLEYTNSATNNSPNIKKIKLDPSEEFFQSAIKLARFGNTDELRKLLIPPSQNNLFHAKLESISQKKLIELMGCLKANNLNISFLTNIFDEIYDRSYQKGMGIYKWEWQIIKSLFSLSEGKQIKVTVRKAYRIYLLGLAYRELKKDPNSYHEKVNRFKDYNKCELDLLLKVSNKNNRYLYNSLFPFNSLTVEAFKKKWAETKNKDPYDSFKFLAENSDLFKKIFNSTKNGNESLLVEVINKLVYYIDTNVKASNLPLKYFFSDILKDFDKYGLAWHNFLQRLPLGRDRGYISFELFKLFRRKGIFVSGLLKDAIKCKNYYAAMVIIQSLDRSEKLFKLAKILISEKDEFFIRVIYGKMKTEAFKSYKFIMILEEIYDLSPSIDVAKLIFEHFLYQAENTFTSTERGILISNAERWARTLKDQKSIYRAKRIKLNTFDQLSNEILSEFYEAIKTLANKGDVMAQIHLSKLMLSKNDDDKLFYENQLANLADQYEEAQYILISHRYPEDYSKQRPEKYYLECAKFFVSNSMCREAILCAITQDIKLPREVYDSILPYLTKQNEVSDTRIYLALASYYYYVNQDLDRKKKLVHYMTKFLEKKQKDTYPAYFFTVFLKDLKHKEELRKFYPTERERLSEIYEYQLKAHVASKNLWFDICEKSQCFYGSCCKKLPVPNINKLGSFDAEPTNEEESEYFFLPHGLATAQGKPYMMANSYLYWDDRLLPYKKKDNLKIFTYPASGKTLQKIAKEIGQKWVTEQKEKANSLYSFNIAKVIYDPVIAEYLAGLDEQLQAGENDDITNIKKNIMYYLNNLQLSDEKKAVENWFNRLSHLLDSNRSSGKNDVSNRVLLNKRIYRFFNYFQNSTLEQKNIILAQVAMQENACSDRALEILEILERDILFSTGRHKPNQESSSLPSNNKLDLKIAIALGQVKLEIISQFQKRSDHRNFVEENRYYKNLMQCMLSLPIVNHPLKYPNECRRCMNLPEALMAFFDDYTIDKVVKKLHQEFKKFLIIFDDFWVEQDEVKDAVKKCKDDYDKRCQAYRYFSSENLTEVSEKGILNTLIKMGYIEGKVEPLW